MPATLQSLETRKAEIEDWFRDHPDSPNAAEIREEYRTLLESIKQSNTTQPCQTN